MSKPVTPGPVTITVSHGMVVVAERTYKDARRARLAFKYGPPAWFRQPIVTLLRGRMPRRVGE